MTKIILLFLILVFYTVLAAYLIPLDIDVDYCSVCATRNIIDSLESEKNIKADNEWYHREDVKWALEMIWDEYNYGYGRSRNEDHLVFLEKYRISNNYNTTSFKLINLSNPKPIEPELKYVETGNISEHKTWQEAGGYSKITMESGNVFTNSKLNPYPFDYNSTIVVFKVVYSYPPAQPQGCLYELSKYPNISMEINQSWDVYYTQLDEYFYNGGV